MNAQTPPDHLYIELTDRCNLKCRHCYLAASPGGAHTLAAPVVEAALTDFAALGGYSIAFSGGEPLLHPHWAPLTAYARSLGLRTTLVTNGTLLTRQTIAALLEQEVILALSLDGIQAATHDAIRGDGSYARVRAALDRLIEAQAQARVIICFTPMRLNIHELAALTARLSDEGFRYFYISPLEERGRERSHRATLSLDLDARVQLLTQLAFLMTQEESAITVETGHLRYMFERMLQAWDGSGDPMEGTLRIAPTGAIYLTAYVDDDRFRLGDVHTHSLKTCWRSTQIRELFAESYERLAGMPTCADCPYWIVCGGGSPARAYAIHGRFMEPDDFCEAKRLFLERWFRAL